MPADDQNPSRSGGRPLRKQGEEAIGKFAQDLLENPLVSGTLSAVFETRERATRAQEVAMSALNLPSAADIERLTRRVRSVAQRIEGVEDNLDRIIEKLERVGKISSLEDRLTAIETSLERIEQKLAEPPAAPKRAPAKPAAGSKATAGTSPTKPAAETTGADVAETTPPVPVDDES